MKKTWLHFIFMVDINKQRVKLRYGKYNQKALVLFVSIADYIRSSEYKKVFSCCFLGKLHVLILPIKNVPGALYNGAEMMQLCISGLKGNNIH